MKPVQKRGGQVAQWVVAVGKHGGRLFGEPGVEKDLFGRFDGVDSFGESGPEKSGVLAKMGEICPWTTFSGKTGWSRRMGVLRS